jgi:cobaltochelatase CobN
MAARQGGRALELLLPGAGARSIPVSILSSSTIPAEAAPAKRRIGAVTIGHLTPPLVQAGLSGEAAALYG